MREVYTYCNLGMNYEDEKEDLSKHCPGCDKSVPPADIRKHIEQCSRYPLTILKEVGRFDHRVPPNVIYVPA